VKLLPNWDSPQATGIFADNFFMDYFPNKLKAEATEIFARAGKITRVGEVVAENNLRGYFIMTGEKGNIRVSGYLNAPEPAADTGISYLVCEVKAPCRAEHREASNRRFVCSRIDPSFPRMTNLYLNLTIRLNHLP
jgi:hypothetical protein